MLTMKIVHEKEELEQICSMAGICPEGSCCYVAREGKKLVGYCLYRPEEYGLHIMSVECFGDISLFDGLIRATAATLFDRPEDRVTFGERVDQALLKRYGFVSVHTDCINSANQFLQGCKNCKS